MKSSVNVLRESLPLSNLLKMTESALAPVSAIGLKENSLWIEDLLHLYITVQGSSVELAKKWLYPRTSLDASLKIINALRKELKDPADLQRLNPTFSGFLANRGKGGDGNDLPAGTSTNVELEFLLTAIRGLPGRNPKAAGKKPKN